jgi:SAM-dependent methyltransferase
VTIASKAREAFEKSFETALTPAEADYLTTHKKRILKSIEWLAPYIRADSSILELGGGMFPEIFQAVYPDIRGDNTNTDLRFPLPIPSEQYDVVVNTELIEHLKDRVESPVDRFDFSGLRMLLSESYRVLKPGGITFVTTPNASSMGVIYRILMGRPPYYYLPHVREYTIHEVRDFLEELHFSVERIETLNVYNDLTPDKRDEILHLLASKGYSLDYRGECTFIVARK